MKYIINIIMIMLILVVLLPSALAETATINSSVSLGVSNDTLTLLTPAGTTTYSVSSQLQNQTQVNSFTFTRDILCQSESLNQNLINYTSQLVGVCKEIQEDKRNCEAVYQTNVELSYEILGLRSANDTLTTLQPQYDQLQSASGSQIEKIQELQIEADKVPQLERDKYLWAVLGIVLGAIGYWYFKEKRNYPESRSGKELKRVNSDDKDQTKLYPSRMDKEK